MQNYIYACEQQNLFASFNPYHTLENANFQYFWVNRTKNRPHHKPTPFGKYISIKGFYLSKIAIMPNIFAASRTQKQPRASKRLTKSHLATRRPPKVISISPGVEINLAPNGYQLRPKT